MAAPDETYGGIVNRRGLPPILLGLAILLVLVSFAVGWFSVDAVLHRWDYDETAKENAGAPFPSVRLDLEMHMLKITANANPIALEERIRERGEPTYDNHAGRTGTVMLGVLMVQFTVLLSLLAASGFYYLHRKKRTDFSGVTKRLFLVFIIVTTLGLLYFGLRIGPSAQDDERYILEHSKFTDDAPVSPVEPDVGFWRTWKSFKTRVEDPNTGNTEVWQIEVISRPSAGFWLTVAALGCGIAARVVAQRNGDFSPEPPQEPMPSLPKIASG